MTLLSVVKDVCAVVGVTIPSAVIPGITGNRTMQEMLALANEMAQRIAYDTREWTVLTIDIAIPGTGVTAYALPANYKRMLKTTNVWRSTSALEPMRFIASYDEWLQHRARNYVDSRGEWMLAQGAIIFSPALAANTLPLWANGLQYNTLGVAVYDDLNNTSWKVAVVHISAPSGTTFAQDRAANPTYWTSTPNVPATARFAYLDKNCVLLASGGFGDRFMSDSDSFRLDERLLTLGMIWQWKANKGGAYAEDLGTYADALAYVQGADKPAPIIIGRQPISANARVAYPWPVPS